MWLLSWQCKVAADPPFVKQMQHFQSTIKQSAMERGLLISINKQVHVDPGMDSDSQRHSVSNRKEFQIKGWHGWSRWWCWEWRSHLVNYTDVSMSHTFTWLKSTWSHPWHAKWNCETPREHHGGIMTRFWSKMSLSRQQEPRSPERREQWIWSLKPGHGNYFSCCWLFSP